MEKINSNSCDEDLINKYLYEKNNINIIIFSE